MTATEIAAAIRAAIDGTGRFGAMDLIFATMPDDLRVLLDELDRLQHDHHQVRADAQARVDAAVLRALAAERERDELKSHLRNALDTDLSQRAGIEQEREITALTAERDELRARLAELEKQEPVATAWIRTRARGVSAMANAFPWPPYRAGQEAEYWKEKGYHEEPLYARPVPATPDGWRLVPVDPTPGMLEAGLSAQNEAWNVHYAHIYAEMIAAAPEAAR